MRLSKVGAAMVVLAGIGALATWPDAGRSARAVAGPDFPAALLGIGELALAVASAWLLVVAAAGLVRLRLPGVPRAVQALLFVAVVTTGGTAHADPGHDMTGLTLPDRPTISAPAPAPVVAVDDGITVRRGDTLWALAARSLPPGAPAADVAAACDGWYRTNRSVIGSDPDLIVPGQVLHPPREKDAP